jgi:transcription elongation factor Elf1
MSLRDYGDESSDDSGKPKNFDEFDCPLCNANNPYGDGFKENDEIRCYYCGQEYKVKIDGSGKLKLKEL